MRKHGLFAYNVSSDSFDSESSIGNFLVLGIKKNIAYHGGKKVALVVICSVLDCLLHCSVYLFETQYFPIE